MLSYHYLSYIYFIFDYRKRDFTIPRTDKSQTVLKSKKDTYDEAITDLYSFQTNVLKVMI